MNGSEILAALAAPFPIEEIQWKQQTNPKEGFAVMVAYIDARTVAQRLNEVCGLDWSSSFSPAATGGGKAVECRLKIGNATRADVGTETDIEGDKGGYSDAFKRAAVQYGIGSYLYRFPKVKAACAPNSKFLTREAENDLQRLTQAIYSGVKSLPRFEHLKVWDYAPIQFPQAHSAPQQEQETPAPVTYACWECEAPVNADAAAITQRQSGHVRCKQHFIEWKSKQAQTVEVGS